MADPDGSARAKREAPSESESDDDDSGAEGGRQPEAKRQKVGAGKASSASRRRAPVKEEDGTVGDETPQATDVVEEPSSRASAEGDVGGARAGPQRCTGVFFRRQP